VPFPNGAVRGSHPSRRRGTPPSGGIAHSQIICETGAGRLPTIVIAGFLPDATESIEYQREHLARYGDVSTIRATGFRRRSCSRRCPR
jgi:hypothetical protein